MDKTFVELTGIKQKKKRDKTTTQERLKKQRQAVQTIWKAWKAYIMKRTFKWLKIQLSKMERALANEVLKRLSPNEAKLLRDPVFQSRIRFRLGGSEFPPKILFKIYTKGMNVHYFSGHRIITAHSQAAEDSFNVMGAKQYQEKVFLDDYRQDAFKIGRLYEVTDKMEYIQYMNTLDLKPTYMGGRNNGWREITLPPFVIQTIHFDTTTRLLQTKSWNGSDQGKQVSRKKEILDKTTQKLLDRYGDSKTGTAEKEDDFGLLFEWSNNLDEAQLGDYTIHV